MIDFLPTGLAGLRIWLDAQDAATIIQFGGLVSQWNDKSGNGFNVAQAIAASRPAFGTPNDQEGISFDGVDDRLFLENTPLGFEPRTATIIVVATHEDNTGSQDIVEFNNGVTLVWVNRKNGNDNRGFLQGAGGGTLQIDDNVVADETRWQIWRNRIVGGNSDALDDQGNTATRTYTGGETAPDEISIGSNDGPALFFDGTVHEVIVYDRFLSDPERDQVVAYLNFKWLGGFNAVHTLPAPTQSATLVAAESLTVTAAHSLSAPTQASTARVIVKASAAQVLPAPTMAASLAVISGMTAAHALPAPTQSVSIRVGERRAIPLIGSVAGPIALKGSTPRISLTGSIPT